jgi:hypothetical protein
VNKGKRKGRSADREDARGFAGWHHGGRRKGSVVDHRGDMMMRWYNPALGGFEWREAPDSDEEALSALEGSPFTPSSAHRLTGSGAGWARASWRPSSGQARRPDA